MYSNIFFYITSFENIYETVTLTMVRIYINQVRIYSGPSSQVPDQEIDLSLFSAPPVF